MPDHDASCSRTGWEKRAREELGGIIRTAILAAWSDEAETDVDAAADMAVADIWALLTETRYAAGSPAKDYLGWRMLGGIAVDVMPAEKLPPGAVAIMPLGQLAAYFRANLDRLELENVAASDLAGS